MFKILEYIEKQAKNSNLSFKTVKLLFIRVWNFPNLIVKKYFTAEQAVIKYLFSFVPNAVKEPIGQLLPYFQPWNCLSKTQQIALATILSNMYDKLSPEAKAFLVHVNKAVPNFVELAGGAIRPSIIKVLMGPMRKAIGDSSTAFSGIMDFSRIFTIEDFIEKRVNVGGREMKYNHLHLESAKVSFVVKLVCIGGKAYISGLEKGSLTSVATYANYAAEFPSKGLTLIAEKRFDMGKEDLSPTEFINQYGERYWLLEVFFGGLSRIYVATVSGNMVAKTGIYKFSRDVGNNLELILVKGILNNETIYFDSNDHIGSKYTKCVNAGENGMIAQAKCGALSLVEFPIDVLSEFIPYALGGYPLMTLTRTTAFIFEKHMRFINGDQAAQLEIYEQCFEAVVILAAIGTVTHYAYDYFYPENKNDNNQEIIESVYVKEEEMPGIILLPEDKGSEL